MQYKYLPKVHYLGNMIKDFIGRFVALILGDNIEYMELNSKLCLSKFKSNIGATIFIYEVPDPERYGVG